MIKAILFDLDGVLIETEKEISVEGARKVLGCAVGVDVVDNPAEKVYPMPINAAWKFNLEVGRIRQNLVFGAHGLEFFLSGDQLLRGAALNAVQIAEELVAKNIL